MSIRGSGHGKYVRGLCKITVGAMIGDEIYVVFITAECEYIGSNFCTKIYVVCGIACILKEVLKIIRAQ